MENAPQPLRGSPETNCSGWFIQSCPLICPQTLIRVRRGQQQFADRLLHPLEIVLSVVAHLGDQPVALSLDLGSLDVVKRGVRRLRRLQHVLANKECNLQVVTLQVAGGL